MKFRQKPIVPEVVEAEQWDGMFYNGGLLSEVKRDVFSHEGGCLCYECHKPIDGHGTIKNKGKKHIVCPLDWVIKSKNEIHICKPDVFLKTYELVES